MFGIGLPELTIILVIGLVVFGARKLPEIGAGMGKSIRNFKREVSGSETESPQKLPQETVQ
jgi:sec-independent protein translocase protein TatA